RPAAISESYPLPLFAITGSNRYRMLATLRAFPQAHAVFPFGESLHYTDRRADAPAEAIASELAAYLRDNGYTDVEIRPIVADIEDSFMHLMIEAGPSDGEASA